MTETVCRKQPRLRAGSTEGLGEDDAGVRVDRVVQAFDEQDRDIVSGALLREVMQGIE